MGGSKFAIPPKIHGGGNVEGGSISRPGSQRMPNTYDPVILKSIEKIAKHMPEVCPPACLGLQHIENAINKARDNGTGNVDIFVAFQHGLEMFEGTMGNFPETDIKQKAFRALGGLRDIVNFMGGKLGDFGTISEDEVDGVLEAFADIRGRVNELLATGVANGVTMDRTNGGSSGGSSSNFGSGPGANEKYKANMELKNLANQEARLDAMFQNLMEFNKELIAVEVEMKALLNKGINLANIRELLRKVLVILGRIRELWSNLVKYFQIVAVKAEVINNSYLKVFAEMMEDSAKILTSEAGAANMRQFLMDELAEHAMDIQIVSYYLQTLCRTYTRISSQHILGRLAGVAQLLGANSDEERTAMITKLHRETDAARQGIIQIIKETRATYQADIAYRKAELTDMIEKLGEATAEEIEEVRKGIALAENNKVNEDPIDGESDFSLD